MTFELNGIAARWREAGRAAVVVEVARAEGSVPREAGTRMLVAADEVAGSIGGGHLEWQAIAAARRQLAGAADEPAERRYALGPSLGQCCGGVVVLRFTPLAGADPAAWPLPPPRFDLQLYGAGHVGRAIVRLLEAIPCRVRWLDERDDAFPDRPLPAHIEVVPGEPIAAEVADSPPGACHLVMTHSHDLDLAIVDAVLARGDFAFLGLIGSRSKRARFAARLRERGRTPELIERIVCPIGLPGITGKEPEVIAVAAVAQLLSM